MAFENFRARCASLLVGFDFSDEDIRNAVRAVRGRGLEPFDKYVVAQLKLAFMGATLKAKSTTAPEDAAG